MKSEKARKNRQTAKQIIITAIIAAAIIAGGYLQRGYVTAGAEIMLPLLAVPWIIWTRKQ